MAKGSVPAALKAHQFTAGGGRKGSATAKKTTAKKSTAKKGK